MIVKTLQTFGASSNCHNAVHVLSTDLAVSGSDLGPGRGDLLVTRLGRHGAAVTRGQPRGAPGDHSLHSRGVVAANIITIEVIMKDVKF